MQALLIAKDADVREMLEVARGYVRKTLRILKSLVKRESEGLPARQATTRRFCGIVSVSSEYLASRRLSLTVRSLLKFLCQGVVNVHAHAVWRPFSAA